MALQNNIAGPGMGLPLPQPLYPSYISGIPYTPGSNLLTLPPAGSFILPAGTWMISNFVYSVVQTLEPVTGVWRTIQTNIFTPHQISSDGANYRIFNPTGALVAAVVTNGGSGYVQSTTTCVASTGNSVLYPIVGGNVATITVNTSGTNYTLPPTVVISAPPSPGVQATAYATLSGGSVSTITLTNQGAGYPTAPTVTLIPSPLDPNLGSITNATATANLSGAGKVTAVLVQNSGQALTAAPTLTIAGAGTSAAATAVWCATTTAVSATTGGTGSGTAMQITSIGGQVSATAAFTNPAIELTTAIPRPLQAYPTVSAGVLKTPITVVDGGLFFSTPTAIVNVSGGVISTTAPVATPVLGSTADTGIIQAC